MNRLLALLAIVCLVMVSCKGDGGSKYSSTQDYIDRYVPDAAKKIVGSDDHGGFMGDGRRWEIYELSEKSSEDLRSRIATDTKWKALPLSEDLKKLSFAFHSDLPADSADGFYFFHDFQPEWYPDYESNKDPVGDRSSVNFVIMIFIPSEQKIYVDNLDT